MRRWCCGSGPASEWLIWPIPMVLAPFAGVFYPDLGAAAVRCARSPPILPPSYVFEGMRAVVAGGQPPWDGLAIAAALALVYLLGACWLFARLQVAIRSGLLARYSAETVS